VFLHVVSFRRAYETQKVRAVVEYFLCMIGSTAEAWSYCSSVSDRDLLRVWFSCSPSVLSEHGVKMSAALEVCARDKKHAAVCILVSEGTRGVKRSTHN
jgi:hypothetical protein